MQLQYIDIKGARVHNLKNVSVKIPKNKLVVFTGISGSGKSSLAFDTIYAEGQRRYVESLSSYARQFLGLMDKPDVDQIDGLSPVISIDQRSVAANPRSTLGTITEIYDHLRLLYSRIGHVHCPNCGTRINQQSPSQILEETVKISPKSDLDILVLAPVVVNKTGDHGTVLEEILKAGYSYVRVNKRVFPIAEIRGTKFDENCKHNIEVVVNQFTVPNLKNRKSWPKENLAKAINLALDLGNGHIIINRKDNGADLAFFQYYHCPQCNISIGAIEPRTFSFNSPAGACPKCLGLGLTLEVDPDLVIPNRRLTLAQGAIKPWARNFFNQSWYWKIMKLVSEKHKFSLDTPVEALGKKELDIILYGTGSASYELDGDDPKIFEGVINLLYKKFQDTSSDYLKKEIGHYMRESVCSQCNGKRLKKEALSVTVLGSNIAQVSAFNIDQASQYFSQFTAPNKNGAKTLTANELKISNLIIKEIIKRLNYLKSVGLNYLTLDRSAGSLSGGEAQRVKLATQTGLSLSGVIYVLDEPSIGLHQRDNQKLIDSLKSLRDLGNTVIVVEHDPMMMEAADEIVDIGPGAGDYGGEIVAQGTYQQIIKDKNSLTGKYLSGSLKLAAPKSYRGGSDKFIEVIGASEFNLKNINVKIPLAKLVCLTGVSGSGKSTLMLEILAKALARKFYRTKEIPGQHKEIKGLENIDKVISIDQSPIGRTPRSNPATYTGLFTYIRDLFTQLPESKIRCYGAGKFSFNSREGRCEGCSGEGMVKIEMQFLPDVYIQCEECHGRRYKPEVLEIHYHGKNIADILNMPVEEAIKFFAGQKIIYDKLKTLFEVGLGYIKLGQSATTLSGGEAQRVKLATELSRRATGKTLYILDEPTTGLHFEDVKGLLKVLNKLVDKGNTVLIIEHNLDVIKCADWVIDLGPEGGDKGGYVVAEGTPKDITKVKKSYTGQYLKKVL